MTDNLQPLYDILGDAFKAGAAHAKDETLSAADSLFPLAARMEEEVQKLIEAERQECAEIADVLEKKAGPESIGSTPFMDTGGTTAWAIAKLIRMRSLPSSPERET